ncbi:hypothetical protein GGF46_004250 [Coemansia sp. RSA 552]|nr:hypothetical protein GGF46_004250 [Coemansia sp. RSA 552]
MSKIPRFGLLKPSGALQSSAPSEPQPAHSTGRGSVYASSSDSDEEVVIMSSPHTGRPRGSLRRLAISPETSDSDSQPGPSTALLHGTRPRPPVLNNPKRRRVSLSPVPTDTHSTAPRRAQPAVATPADEGPLPSTKDRPPPARRRAWSMSFGSEKDPADQSSDEIEDTAALLLSKRHTGRGDGVCLEDVVAVYKRQEQLYLKHRRLADRAADEMRCASRMIVRLSRMQGSEAGRDAPSETEDTAPVFMSVGSSVKPFQFNTRRHAAFNLKPRAAFSCQIEGIDRQTVVAYGMDGAVQLWDPVDRRLVQKLTRESLGINFAEQVTQVTPSIFAVVTGASSKPGALDHSREVVFLGQPRGSSRHRTYTSLEFLQHWKRPLLFHGIGGVSVAEGVPSLAGHNSGLMLSGGETDKKVLVWSLKTSDHTIEAKSTPNPMRTCHKSRISALSFESSRGLVLSGSEGGWLNINNAETGQNVARGTDERWGRDPICSISVCPTSPNLVMVNCGSKDKQLRLFDLRERLSLYAPAVVLGVSRECSQSRYIRPAWHPQGRLVFCPMHQTSTETEANGMVAIWDTRYTQCMNDQPQEIYPHNERIWSAAFTEGHVPGQPVMVTTSNDRTIGFTDMRV